MTKDTSVPRLHADITAELETLGAASPYAADANEPDPRYRGYGVRAPEMKRLNARYRPVLAKLDTDEKIALATRLIASGYGEQKSVALAILERMPKYFSPDRFDLLESLVRGLHGWSKIDSFCIQLFSQILDRHQAAFLHRLTAWNSDPDLWLRRASVVVFTRKVAETGLYLEPALTHCKALIRDPEHMVQMGVGWCLKDMMRAHRDVILPYVIDLRRQGISSKITLYALRDIKGDDRKAILAQAAPPQATRR